MARYFSMKQLCFGLIVFFVFTATSFFILPTGLSLWALFVEEIIQIVATVLISGVIISFLSYCLFSKSTDDYNKILMAIRAGEMIPFYQPIFNELSGRLYGAEILCRWKTGTGEMIRPDFFIPIVERAGLMVDMTRSLLQQAEYDLMTLGDEIPHEFNLSLNISLSEVLLKELTPDLIRFQENFNNRIKLVVELTEQLNVDISEVFVEQIIMLKNCGVQVALDDFGTGYSNLTLLERIPADIIKIDKSFTFSLTDNIDKFSVVNDIIAIADRRQMRIIVEGVETAFQVKFLGDLNIHLQQGYYWSVPLSFSEFTNYLVCNS